MEYRTRYYIEKGIAICPEEGSEYKLSGEKLIKF
jgi:hypothetical protein